jgi:hypothetical protein
MAELENELARLDAQLQRHLAAAPPEREENTDVLAQLPHAEVDLNALAGDRRRRFLDAFRMEMHYDVRTGRALFRAGIRSRTTWERAATSHDGMFVVVDGAWPLPPRGPRSL